MSKSNRYDLDAETREECLCLIDLALNEDLGSTDRVNQLDCTTESIVSGNVIGKANIVSREKGVVCGIAVCQLIVDRVDRELTLDIELRDGDSVEPMQTIAVISGDAQDILIVERTCLNFLGRLSGISTLTSRFVAQTVGSNARIYDTRKTTPGWRRLEKYAAMCGGGENHRLGLFDAILIKDNHLAMLAKQTEDTGNEVEIAIDRARNWIRENTQRLINGRKTILQIEVDRIDQLKLALKHHPDIILLDNMDVDSLVESVEIRNQIAPDVQLEASGGVNLETVRKIATTGVDRISVGALTHSALNFDIGLDWELS